MRLLDTHSRLGALDRREAGTWSSDSFHATVVRAWTRIVLVPVHRILDDLLRAGELAELDGNTLADIGLRRE